MFSALAIKRFLAVAMLLCFFLPLSQCSLKAPQQEDSKSPSTSSVIVFVPAEELRFERLDESVFVIAFLWPLLAVALEYYVRNKRGLATISAAEVALSLASISALLQIFRLYDEVLFGGRLLFLLLSSFLACSTYTLYRHVSTKSA